MYQCDILIKSAPVYLSRSWNYSRQDKPSFPHSYCCDEAWNTTGHDGEKITALSFENLKDDSGHNPIVKYEWNCRKCGDVDCRTIPQQCQQWQKVCCWVASAVFLPKVIIIGAGIVGEYAARTALAMGASVKVFDNNIYRLKRMQNAIGQRMWLGGGAKILAKQLKTCDVAVGALSSTGGDRTPVVASEEMVSAMRPVVWSWMWVSTEVGVFETSEVTSHEQPIFLKHGVIHYCVPNIPSGFACTASQAISNVLMPLLLEIGRWRRIGAFALAQTEYPKWNLYVQGGADKYYLSQRFDLKIQIWICWLPAEDNLICNGRLVIQIHRNHIPADHCCWWLTIGPCNDVPPTADKAQCHPILVQVGAWFI